MQPHSAKSSHFALLLIVLLLAGCVLLYVLFDPVQHAWMPWCPLHKLTGWNCPACGMQRALHALFGGRLAEALAYNYFFILSLPYVLALLVAEVLKLMQRGGRFVSVVRNARFAHIFMALCVLWGIVRNLLHI